MMRDDCMKGKYFFLVFVFAVLFVSPSAYAAKESQDGGLLTGQGSAITGTLKTAGLMAASFVLPGVITNFIAGGNKAAQATSQKASTLGSGGALIGGMLLGSKGGALLGALGSLAGGIWGAVTMPNPMATLQRGLVTRVISLKPENARAFDTKYKIDGSDQPTNDYNVEFKWNHNFVKKEKNVYYQFTPVKISKGKNNPKEINTVVLRVDTNGLPDLTISEKLPNSVAQLGLTQNQTADATTQDPYADALELNHTEEIGWCKVDDEGILLQIDKNVSKMYVEDVVQNEMKPGKDLFVLLIKNIAGLKEEINIPNYNCFGPNNLKGTTGPEAKPKVSFDWRWENINGSGDPTYCSNDSNIIYCDSTQFTEFLLSKLEHFNSNYATNEQLKKVISTSDLNINEKDDTNKIYHVLNFKAYLMMDGYTKDFLNDFKEYVLKQNYLGFQKEQQSEVSGLLPDKIVFRPLSNEVTNPEGYKLPQAGMYAVTIEILYKDVTGNKNIFLSNVLNENVDKIIVYFEPVSRRNEPYYYMPLDATVGVVNNQINRVGYGVDYSGDSIWFKNTPGDSTLLEPSLTSDSSPIVHLALEQDASTQSLNGLMRSTVLQILPKSGVDGATYTVKRYLSLPSVTKLTIKKNTDGPIWAYYSIDFGGAPQNAGPSFVYWTLYCGYDESTNTFKGDCQTFNGLKPSDEMFRPDTLGLLSKVAPTGQLQGSVYGLEWTKNSITRDVNEVEYLGLVYLPEDRGSGSINMNLATDGASFNNGNTKASITSTEEKIRDIDTIYSLVDQNKICISPEQGSSGARFWWNPEMVLKNYVKTN